MKKKIAALVIGAALLLFVPIPGGVYKDGGTRVYRALTYKIVSWNRLVSEEETYRATSVYWLPDNFKTLDELWELEQSR